MEERYFRAEKHWVQIQISYKERVVIEPIEVIAAIEKASLVIAKSEQLLAQLHLDKKMPQDPHLELRSYFERRGWKITDLNSSGY